MALLSLDADIADGHATYQTNGDGSLVARPVGGWADTPGMLVSVYENTTGALLATTNASLTPVAYPDPMAGWYRWDTTITAWTTSAGALLPAATAASSAGAIGLRGTLPLPAGTGTSAGGAISFSGSSLFSIPGASVVTSGGGLSISASVGLPAGTGTSAGGAISHSLVTTWLLPAATATASAGDISISTASTAVSDSFTGTNGAGLGTNWTTITGYAAPVITSNAVGSPTLGTRAGAYWSAGSITNNHYAEIDHNAVFPCVRIQSGAATYYKLEWWYDDVELFTGAYELKRVVAGTASAALASAAWDGSTAGGKVRLEVTDVGGNPRLVAKKGASTLFTYDDTSGSKITTAGRPGIDTTMNGAAGDNFAAGDL